MSGRRVPTSSQTEARWGAASSSCPLTSRSLPPYLQREETMAVLLAGCLTAWPLASKRLHGRVVGTREVRVRFWRFAIWSGAVSLSARGLVERVMGAPWGINQILINELTGVR